jgi:V8-like Glu-specific endopeptidase
MAFAKTVEIRPKVIYGIDDRLDYYESSDSLMKKISKGVAAQIRDTSLFLENGEILLKSKTLMEKGVCADEAFSNQPAAANCSGFLIRPDVLVTAGHCVTSLLSCENFSWVFDYTNTVDEKTSFTFSPDQVYKCVEIIKREKNSTTGSDFAVVKLDRPVLNRPILKVRNSGSVNGDAIFTTIGFPSGLPLKITTGGVMRDNSKEHFFVLNSDTYHGNSGSPVIDTRTGIVEGILVRGDTDFVESEEGKCSRSNVHANNAGRGEDVTRITVIK